MTSTETPVERCRGAISFSHDLSFFSVVVFRSFDYPKVDLLFRYLTTNPDYVALRSDIHLSPWSNYTREAKL